MYEPAGRQFPSLAFLWPGIRSRFGEQYSRADRQAIRRSCRRTRRNAGPQSQIGRTPHTIALELKTVRLRNFSAENDGSAALVCAPFALHGAAIADLAPGHSLVAALRDAGLRRLFLADWCSATADTASLLTVQQCSAFVRHTLGGNQPLSAVWLSRPHLCAIPRSPSRGRPRSSARFLLLSLLRWR